MFCPDNPISKEQSVVDLEILEQSKVQLDCVTCSANVASEWEVQAASTSETSLAMRLKRVVAHMLPVVVGLLLLIWGLKVMYTSFSYGTMPWAGWETERKSWFGMTWLAAYFIVLLPAYLYAISQGLQSYRASQTEVRGPDGRCWLSVLGISTLLVALTFCTRVAVTAWFPSPMHTPFEGLRGGVIPGAIATIILLATEVRVLLAIKQQKQGQHQPLSLLIPGLFGVVLLIWAGWITYTAFTEGSLPVVGWHTDHPRWFGLAWLIAFFVVLLPAYIYSIGLGILGWLERDMRQQLSPQNHWLVAIGITAMLSVVTFCTRIAVTAWFPEQMHPPLHQFEGGLVGGGIMTLVLLVVMALFYRVARNL